MYKQDELDLIASSTKTLSVGTLDDGFDGESRMDVPNIHMMHSNFNPSPLLQHVLMKKNSQYEIFMILNQTQIDRIGKKIIQSSSLETSMRQEFVEERIKQIKRIVEQQTDKFFMDLMLCHHRDRESTGHDSNASDNSIQQTAVYSYVENYEKLRVQRGRAREDRKVEQKIENLTDHLVHDKTESLEKKLDFRQKKEAAPIYGFRYGQGGRVKEPQPER
jgi:hypothetical protein